MKPDYRLIAELEREIYGEIYGEIYTVDESAFRHRCLGCRTVNWGGRRGMEHAFDCTYRHIQTSTFRRDRPR